MPDAEAIRQALERRLIGFSFGRLAWQKITEFAAGLSTADVVAAAEDAARRAVLADHRAIATGDLIGAIERRRSLQGIRSEEHTSELQSLMRISYAVFCLKKKTHKPQRNTERHDHIHRPTALTTTSTNKHTTNNNSPQ